MTIDQAARSTLNDFSTDLDILINIVQKAEASIYKLKCRVEDMEQRLATISHVLESFPVSGLHEDNDVDEE